MIHKKCDTCLFGDKCRSISPCNNYYPITDDAEDECIQERLNNEYQEFCDAWRDYSGQYKERCSL